MAKFTKDALQADRKRLSDIAQRVKLDYAGFDPKTYRERYVYQDFNVKVDVYLSKRTVVIMSPKYKEPTYRRNLSWEQLEKVLTNIYDYIA